MSSCVIRIRTENLVQFTDHDASDVLWLKPFNATQLRHVLDAYSAKLLLSVEGTCAYFSLCACDCMSISLILPASDIPAKLIAPNNPAPSPAAALEASI